MVAAIVFGDHLLRIILTTDCGFEVNNSVVFVRGSDPFVCSEADLFSVTAVIEATRARKQSREVDLESELTRDSNVGSISFDELFGCGKLAHRADGIIYAGVDDVIDAVEYDNGFRADCCIKRVLEAFDSCFAPMLLDANFIFAENTVAADSATDDGSVVDAEFGEAASKAIGPGLRGDRIAEGYDGTAILAGKVIYRMDEYVRSAIADREPRDVIGTGIVALRIILCNVVTAVPMTAAELGSFL